MRKSVFSLIIGALMLVLGTPAVKAAEQDKTFEDHAKQINQSTSQSPQKMQTALKTISVETGVPLEKVQAQHKRHPETGAAGLLLANVLAAETKKAPESFLKAHSAGKGWLDIARDNKVPVEKLTVRVESLWRALTPA